MQNIQNIKKEIKVQKIEVKKELDNQMPEKQFSTGAIQATVWLNKSEQGSEYRTVSINRRYKDKEGSWKSTNSMRVNDLPKIALVANEAFKYTVMRDNLSADEF